MITCIYSFFSEETLFGGKCELICCFNVNVVVKEHTYCGMSLSEYVNELILEPENHVWDKEEVQCWAYQELINTPDSILQELCFRCHAMRKKSSIKRTIIIIWTFVFNNIDYQMNEVVTSNETKQWKKYQSGQATSQNLYSSCILFGVVKTRKIYIADFKMFTCPADFKMFTCPAA